jgi:hypothetical protein
MRWTGHVASMGNLINLYTVTVGKSHEKRPLGELSSRWDLRDNFRKIGSEDVEWNQLA